MVDVRGDVLRPPILHSWFEPREPTPFIHIQRMNPKTKNKTDLQSSRHVTWGRPCLQVDNSALTKTEAMIHNEQARNN